MDAQELRNLQEAYNQVYQELDEGEKQFPHKKVDRQVYDAMDSGETAGDSGNAAKEKRDYARAERMRSVAAKHGGKSRMKEEVEEISEAEGSFGQTPKATAAYGKLANTRRETPASEYSERGEKTKKVKSAEKNFYRTLNPDAGNRGKKSTKSIYPGGRKGMTQSDRDYARGRDEYGHRGYDGEGGGGSLPKGKKLERQKKTGVSAESFDLFDYILEHLVAEGYADTNKAAIAIMANMSEEWKQSIVEEVLDEASVTDDRVRRNQKAFGSNYTPPRDWDQSANRGKGAVLNAKQKEKQRRKGLAKGAEEN
jgi:hypothetical protein